MNVTKDQDDVMIVVIIPVENFAKIVQTVIMEMPQMVVLVIVSEYIVS